MELMQPRDVGEGGLLEGRSHRGVGRKRTPKTKFGVLLFGSLFFAQLLGFSYSTWQGSGSTSPP